jgi:hypothetical protein
MTCAPAAHAPLQHDDDDQQDEDDKSNMVQNWARRKRKNNGDQDRDYGPGIGGGSRSQANTASLYNYQGGGRSGGAQNTGMYAAQGGRAAAAPHPVGAPGMQAILASQYGAAAAWPQGAAGYTALQQLAGGQRSQQYMMPGMGLGGLPGGH